MGGEKKPVEITRGVTGRKEENRNVLMEMAGLLQRWRGRKGSSGGDTVLINEKGIMEREKSEIWLP